MALDQAPPASELLVQTTSSTGVSAATSAGVTAVPVGSLMPFAGNTAPSGYLLCDGSAVSRTTYSALFAVIGTVYGVGDGSTTFNVPDVQGRTVYGLSGSSGHADVKTIAATEGTAIANRRPKHKHTSVVTDPGHTHTPTTWVGNRISGNSAGSAGAFYTDGSSFDAGKVMKNSTDTTGITVATGTATDTADTAPYIVMPWVIKT